MASDQSAGGTCASGYRNDDLFIYNAIEGCKVNETLNLVLFCIWSLMFFLALCEFIATTIMHTNKSSTLFKVFYIGWLFNLFLLCLYVSAKQGKVSVASNVADSGVIWVTFFLGNVCAFIALIINDVTLVRGMLVTLNSNVTDEASFNDPNTRLIQLQTTVLTFYSIATFVTCAVLPQALTNPTSRDISIDVFCITFGVCYAISFMVTLYFFHSMQSAALKLLSFHQSMPGKSKSIKALEQLVQRLRAARNLMLGNLIMPLFYIIVGSYLRFRFEVAHTIFGPFCLITIVGVMIVTQSPVFSCLFRSREPTQQQSVSSDPGSQVANKNQLNHSNSTVLSTAEPSSMLATVDFKSLSQSTTSED